MKRGLPLVVFAGVGFAAAAAHLVALTIGWPMLEHVTKPIPAMALGLAVLGTRAGTYPRLVGGGLLVSALADLLLEFRGLFLPGLFVFLVAHVLYAAAFVSDERRLRLARAIPFAIWLGAVGVWVWPGLGGMKIPVVAYMLAIGTMLWRAAARLGRAGDPTPSEWWALVGAILFGLSDTLIAVDRFRAPIPAVDLSIMALYWAGQTGIAASAVIGQGGGETAADAAGGGEAAAS